MNILDSAYRCYKRRRQISSNVFLTFSINIEEMNTVFFLWISSVILQVMLALLQFQLILNMPDSNSHLTTGWFSVIPMYRNLMTDWMLLVWHWIIILKNSLTASFYLVSQYLQVWPTSDVEGAGDGRRNSCWRHALLPAGSKCWSKKEAKFIRWK